MNPLPFDQRKAIGDMAEIEFAEKIALAGGCTAFIGKVPDRPNEAPKIARPHISYEDGYTYSVAPDLVCVLNSKSLSKTFFVQVKVKKPILDDGQCIIYLDETEFHRMKSANSFMDTIFATKLPNNYSDEWLWVDVDDLITMPIKKRRVRGKPTLLIPLEGFRPFHELTKVSVDDAANTNAPPTGK